MNRNSIVPWPPFTPLLNGSLPFSQKGLSSPNMVAFNELWSKLQLSSCALLRHFLASAKELKSRRNISVTTEGYQEKSKINPAHFSPQLRNQMDGCNQTKKELSVGWHENKQKGDTFERGQMLPGLIPVSSPFWSVTNLLLKGTPVHHRHSSPHPPPTSPYEGWRNSPDNRYLVARFLQNKLLSTGTQQIVIHSLDSVTHLLWVPSCIRT